MREWLGGMIESGARDLPEELYGHVLGRGLPLPLMREMRVGIVRPENTPAPDPVYRKRNGPCGEYRAGWLAIPFWSPTGEILGVEYRTWGDQEKLVKEHRLDEAQFSPVFIGLVPSTLQRIWDGGDVWLVEGAFDIALQHALPEKDVVLACGTARVSRRQVDFISRILSPYATVYVAFDMDSTGQTQMEGFIEEKSGRRIPGVIERLSRAGAHVIPVRYLGGKDPGAIWERGGKEALRQAFNL